eukprot:gene8279-11207_t
MCKQRKVSFKWGIRQPNKYISRYLSTNIANEPKSLKPVAYWLFGMGGLVAGMVTVGGITRLTRSGLSMTDWKLQGSLPPLTQEHWQQEFERYKQYPEWQQRKNMTIEEFKYIYFWEYGHRMMGRVIGITFVIPATYFISRGMIPRAYYGRFGLLFSLGLSQGLIGWWMVKSGLNVDPEQRKEIRVSPYRLATHLSMAFTTYTLLIWTGMDMLNTPEKARTVAQSLSSSCLKYSSKIRKLAILNAGLVATTVLSGAYVAGNDAGRAYNTFPMMNDEWIPSSILELEPKWRNFFENTATVQFDHRLLAYSTIAGIVTMYTMSIKSQFWQLIPKMTRVAMHHVAGMMVIQVTLGLSTLLLYVPIQLAVLHQAGSLTLLTFITVLIHTLRFSRYPSSSISSISNNIINPILKNVANGGNHLNHTTT